jgi:hypothetical protein
VNGAGLAETRNSVHWFDMANATAPSSLLSPELLAQLERMELVSRKVFRGRMKGERRSQRKGQSVEFAESLCTIRPTVLEAVSGRGGLAYLLVV